MSIEIPKFLREPGFPASAAVTLPLVWLSAKGIGVGEDFFTSCAAVISLALLVVIGISWMWFARPDNLTVSERRKYRAPRLGAVLACAGIVISVVLTQWPLYFSFNLSQSALDSLADRIVRGEQISFPVRAGFFTIESSDLCRSKSGWAAEIESHRPMVFLQTKDYGTGANFGFGRGSNPNLCNEGHHKHRFWFRCFLNLNWGDFLQQLKPNVLVSEPHTKPTIR